MKRYTRLLLTILALVMAIFLASWLIADTRDCDSKDKTPCGIGPYKPCDCGGDKYGMRKDGEPDNEENTRSKRAKCKVYCTESCCGCPGGRKIDSEDVPIAEQHSHSTKNPFVTEFKW